MGHNAQFRIMNPHQWPYDSQIIIFQFQRFHILDEKSYNSIVLSSSFVKDVLNTGYTIM